MLVRCSDKTDMYEQFSNCWNDDVYPLSQCYWEHDCWIWKERFKWI